MISILFWGSLYFLILSFILLFFACASYGEKPYVAVYENEISSFYDDFVIRMEISGNKILEIFFSNSIIGSVYRHSLVKEYLKNTDKLRDLDFSENEINDINNLIVPGFEERIVLFNMLKAICTFATIILGIGVGLLIV